MSGHNKRKTCTLHVALMVIGTVSLITTCIHSFMILRSIVLSASIGGEMQWLNVATGLVVMNALGAAALALGIILQHMHLRSDRAT